MKAEVFEKLQIRQYLLMGDSLICVLCMLKELAALGRDVGRPVSQIHNQPTVACISRALSDLGAYIRYTIGYS